MLTGLSIRDVVLIDALDLEIEDGFTALTGETGAGKSILLDALGLALGDRADRALVRAGAERASATAAFDVGDSHPARAILSELDLPEPEDGRLVLRRSVSLDGKSRAHVNDAPTSAAVLRRLGEVLLEVHGQHASAGLMDPASHRMLLDLFGRTGAQRNVVAAAYGAMESARAALNAALEAQRRASTDRDYLAHVVAELDRLAPLPGEEEALDQERRFLMGSEKVASALKDAADALADGRAEQRLSLASRALSRIGRVEGDNADRLNTAVEAAAAAFERALVELSDGQGWLHRAGDALDADPGRLEGLEERLFALRGAARKHGVPVAALPEVQAKASAALAAVDNAEQAIDLANQALQQASAAYDREAAVLSARRVEAATALDAAVCAELPPLRLEKARFRTRIDTDPAKPGRDGVDRVSFEIAPNPGGGFGPLSAIASGGELSRLSLALKVALAADGGTLALVFDEVDQGVGGATADAVGRRLAVLSSTAQVLCVTHSPQVAARAAQHWRIEKTVRDGVTRTHVRPLAADEREEELARMLSGAEITAEARAAARALAAGA